jgi:hypothetical protein
MTQKHTRMQAGGANPYVDPAGYKALIDSSEKAFLDRIAELDGGRGR